MSEIETKQLQIEASLAILADLINQPDCDLRDHRVALHCSIIQDGLAWLFAQAETLVAIQKAAS